MAQSKADCDTTTAEDSSSSTMPVASIITLSSSSSSDQPLAADPVGEATCHAAESTTSSSSLNLPSAEDNLSVASPDSGHGTQPDELPNEVVFYPQQPPMEAVPAVPMMINPMLADPMIPLHHPRPGGEYATWINGGQRHLGHHHHPHHPRVMEPVEINPETGFTTVLVDAAAMAGYPHHVAAATQWSGYHHPPHHHPHHHHHHHHHVLTAAAAAAHFPQQQQQHPPPHFLHPHAYHEAMTADYGYQTGPYDPTLLTAPPYDPAAAMFDPSLTFASKGRNQRPTRGSSVSPKRPNNRSTSQNNNPSSANSQRRPTAGQQQQQQGNNGRYTPSPSSGRSRGSSPGQQQQTSNGGSNNPVVINHVGASGPPPPPPPATPGQHVVHLHVNPGETVSLQMGGRVEVIQGPATVRMVSTGQPPVPLPVQVPPGHVLQQIVDERGTLRHVILSPAPPGVVAAAAAAAASGHPPPNSGAGASGAAPVLSMPTTSQPPPPPPHYGTSMPPPTTSATTTTPPLYYSANGQPAAGGATTFGGYPTTYVGAGPPNLIGHPRPPHGAAGVHHHHPQQQHHHQHHQGFNMSANTKGPSPPSPPSPPTVNYQSERAQRQFAKLRKKLESRSNNKAETGAPAATAAGPTPAHNNADTPPSSPKKDNNNIRKLKDRNQNAGPEAEDETDAAKKNEKESLAERITEFKTPQVSDVESRGATVRWEPVETVIVESDGDEAKQLDISYEVVVGHKASKAANSQDKCCYRGKECQFRIADLQPGTDYWVRVSALVEQIKVKDAPVVELRTEPSVPDAPAVPRLQNRTRNSLLVRWASPADNGSPITHYVLECDDGNDQYSEAYRGRNKEFKIIKLQSSTCYAIRLGACNEIGMSDWSEVLRVTTMGAPPQPPPAPTLRLASAKQISLAWAGAVADTLYTLQMADPISGHGFLNVYHGPDNEYTCTALTRSTTYRFRLQAENDDGASRWSEEASYATTADRPVAPARPSVKGRIGAHSFRVRWDPPSDSGGVAVTHYALELDSGDGYSQLWTGTDNEWTCDKLNSGTTYRVRVNCSNGQEQSDFSEPLMVTTEPVCPAAPAAPILAGKARSTSLHLKWERPDYDGGSMVTVYEVNLINPDGSTRIAFSGYETECLVASLLPGRDYAFQVRASNRIGFGPWSELFEIKSGPGVPEAPNQPQSANRSAHSVTLAWNEPANNGAPIIDYRLEVAPHPRVSNGSSAGSLYDAASDTSSVDEQVDVDHLAFTLCHSGSAKHFEVKGLQPWTSYYFRVQAVNSVGPSTYSPVISCTTLASSPSAVTGLRCSSVTATSLSVSWNAPHSNGSAITHYNVEVGDRGIFCTNDASTAFDAIHLAPDTTYRVRVQAANAIGAGAFCPAAKFSTRPLPPDPPRLECVQVGYNSLKLRWGDGKNLDFVNYSVEMQEEGNDRFYLVYEGTCQSYKVSKLKELSMYTFRICARNEVGEGPYSEEVSYVTTRAPPPTLKKPEVMDLTESRCRIVWSGFRQTVPNDCVTYLVEVNRAKETEPIIARRCSESEMPLDGLEAGTEYTVRVGPIRMCQDGEIAGAYSPSKTFTTLSVPSLSAMDSQKSASSQKLSKPLTDQDWILIIITALIAFSILIAVAMNQLGFK